jgi:hypothetical protein
LCNSASETVISALNSPNLVLVEVSAASSLAISALADVTTALASSKTSRVSAPFLFKASLLLSFLSFSSISTLAFSIS